MEQRHQCSDQHSKLVSRIVPLWGTYRSLQSDQERPRNRIRSVNLVPFGVVYSAIGASLSKDTCLYKLLLYMYKVKMLAILVKNFDESCHIFPHSMARNFAENLACFRSPILHYNAIDTTSGWYFIIVNEINVKYITK